MPKCDFRAVNPQPPLVLASGALAAVIGHARHSESATPDIKFNGFVILSVLHMLRALARR